jgi:ribosome maturation factor RimP
VVAIELAHSVEADAAGHDGHVVHVRVVGHGGHGSVEVHVDELRGDVVIEDRRDVSLRRHLAVKLHRFALA